MSSSTFSKDFKQQRRELERAIAVNERRERRLMSLMTGGGKPSWFYRLGIRLPVPRQPDPPSSVYPLPSPRKTNPSPVRFTEDNAPIFMSGNLEEIRVRSATPDQRRNRLVILLIFMTFVLVGVLYVILA